MNITTKYNEGEQILFLYSISNPQNVHLFTGTITNIRIECSNQYILISYDVDVLPPYDQDIQLRQCPHELKIEEKFLFKDERDLFKIFKENIRNYLNPETIRDLRRRRNDDDDLPF